MINITVNNAVVYKVLGLYILFIGLSTGLKKKQKKKNSLGNLAANKVGSLETEHTHRLQSFGLLH